VGKTDHVDNSVGKNLIQPQITGIQNAHPKMAMSAERKKKLDDLALKFLVGKVLPISTMYNNHFITLAKELDPR
jgi:hypothetical protein